MEFSRFFTNKQNLGSQKQRKSYQLLEKSFKNLKNSNIEELVKFYHEVSKEKLFLHKKKKNSVVVDIVKLFKVSQILMH